MELKEAIQKIKVILNGEEAAETVETTEQVAETVETPAEEVIEEVKEEAPAIDIEALLADQKAQFDAQIEAMKADFKEELTKIRDLNKADHNQIVTILEKVSEIPIEEPSEKPRNVFAEHAETKLDKVAKAAEMMKQFRENNKK